MSAAPDSPAISGPVLFFDGECGLCNRIVRLLLRLDRRAVLRYAPLQGPTAQAYLRRHGLPTEDFDTITFVPEWARAAEREFLVRTAGIVGALRALGGVAAFCGAVLAVIPAPVRDAAYRLIARWRYRFFGPWRARSLARVEWGARFLP